MAVHFDESILEFNSSVSQFIHLNTSQRFLCYYISFESLCFKEDNVHTIYKHNAVSKECLEEYGCIFLRVIL